MRRRSFQIACALGFLLLQTLPVTAGGAARVSRELIEETLQRAARRSGRELAEKGLRNSTNEALERLVKQHGGDVLKVVEDGGLELLEGTARYGDEVLDIAMKASPSARRAFACDLPNLLPLVRRVGVESVELEARTPGLASKIYRAFGDDAGGFIAKNVPTEDIPRLLSYAEKADNTVTREMLLEAYKKEGKSLFERVPAKLVLASGLSTSMILGTHEMTAPVRALGDAIRDNEDVAGRAVDAAEKALWFLIAGSCLFLGVVTVCILWRFRLLPWHARRSVSGNPDVTSCTSSRPVSSSGVHTGDSS
jgi:hypothetical protein